MTANAQGVVWGHEQRLLPEPPNSSSSSGSIVGGGKIADHSLGGQQKATDGGSVLKGSTSDFGRIDDSGLDHVDVLKVQGIETLFTLLDALADDGAIDTGVLGDLTDRSKDLDKIALIDASDFDNPVELTHGDIDQRANAVARALVAKGFQRGDRIAILAANSADYLVTYFGTMRAGLVSVPINLPRQCKR